MMPSLTIHLREMFSPQIIHSFDIAKELKVGDMLVQILEMKLANPYGSVVVLPPYNGTMTCPGIDKSANLLLYEIYPEGGEITWMISSPLNPIPSFMMMKYIVDTYKAGLAWPLWIPEMNYNRNPEADKGDTDLFNLQRLGSWDDFGRGPTNPPKDSNNSIDNLIIISQPKQDGSKLRKCVNMLQYMRAVVHSAKEPVFQLNLNKKLKTKLCMFLIDIRRNDDSDYGRMRELVFENEDVTLDLTYHNVLYL